MSKQSIDRLRTLSPKLNKATDEANRVVAMVETFLNDECSIGLASDVVVSQTDVRLDADDDTGSFATEYISLSYERVDGTFRIAVKVERDHEGVDDNNVRRNELEIVSVTPWASCPRATKLDTFPKLAELLNAICKNTEQAIEQTAETSKAVKGILDALQG